MYIMKKVLIILFILSLVLISGCGETVCGTHTETYTSSVKGCDGMSNCQCLHESWAGLGSCDSCECTKEVSNC